MEGIFTESDHLPLANKKKLSPGFKEESSEDGLRNCRSAVELFLVLHETIHTVAQKTATDFSKLFIFGSFIWVRKINKVREERNFL